MRIKITHTHPQINKYNRKSFAVGNKTMNMLCCLHLTVRYVRCVYTVYTTIHWEGTNGVNDHAISKFGILFTQSVFRMIRSHSQLKLYRFCMYSSNIMCITLIACSYPSFVSFFFLFFCCCYQHVVNV